MDVDNDNAASYGMPAGNRPPPDNPGAHMYLNHCKKAPQSPWERTLLCACMALGLMALSVGAQAAPQKNAAEKVASEPAKKKGSVKVKHQRSPSEESTAERDRRLYRECKGLPNAGACLGYTRR